MYICACLYFSRCCLSNNFSFIVLNTDQTVSVLLPIVVFVILGSFEADYAVWGFKNSNVTYSNCCSCSFFFYVADLSFRQSYHISFMLHLHIIICNRKHSAKCEKKSKKHKTQNPKTVINFKSTNNINESKSTIICVHRYRKSDRVN